MKGAPGDGRAPLGEQLRPEFGHGEGGGRRDGAQKQGGLGFAAVGRGGARCAARATASARRWLDSRQTDGPQPCATGRLR